MTYLIEQHKGRGRYSVLERFEDSELAKKEFDLLTTGPNGELSGMYRLRSVKTTRQILQDEHNAEASQMETAGRMLNVLKRTNGKKLTRRVLKPMEESIGQKCYIDQDYGMVHLKTAAYVRGEFKSGCAVSLTIPTPMGDSSLPAVDVDAIEQYNAAYFSAAVERNAVRWEKLESDWPEQVDAAGKAYCKASTAMSDLLAYPCPDSSRIREMQEKAQ